MSKIFFLTVGIFVKTGSLLPGNFSLSAEILSVNALAKVCVLTKKSSVTQRTFYKTKELLLFNKIFLHVFKKKCALNVKFKLSIMDGLCL